MEALARNKFEVRWGLKDITLIITLIPSTYAPTLAELISRSPQLDNCKNKLKEVIFFVGRGVVRT